MPFTPNLTVNVAGTVAPSAGSTKNTLAPAGDGDNGTSAAAAANDTSTSAIIIGNVFIIHSVGYARRYTRAAVS